MKREDYKQLPRIDTPWGVSHTHEEIAPGIRHVTTGSHGGYYLHSDQLAEFQAIFPSFECYAGSQNWFEEDQDWAMVALAFPQHFDDQAIFYAIRTVDISIKMAKQLEKSPQFKGANRVDQWVSVHDWLVHNPLATTVQARSNAFYLANQDNWEAGTQGTAGDGWFVHFTRLGDGNKLNITFPKGTYPTKQFYTAAEIRELSPSLSPEVLGDYKCICGNTKAFIGIDKNGYPGPDECDCEQDPCVCLTALTQPFAILDDGEIVYQAHTGGGRGANIDGYTSINCAECGIEIWSEPEPPEAKKEQAAEALGFASVAEMDDHQEWLKTQQTQQRLEYLRQELRAERISYGELSELQSLVPSIDSDDVELLEAAGVPEFGEEEEGTRSDEPDVDARGQCFSDADPGL